MIPGKITPRVTWIRSNVFGKAYLPAIVAAFREQCPDVTFFLKLGNPGTLLPMLKKGQIDLALVDKFQTQNQYFSAHVDEKKLSKKSPANFNPPKEEQ